MEPQETTTAAAATCARVPPSASPVRRHKISPPSERLTSQIELTFLPFDYSNRPLTEVRASTDFLAGSSSESVSSHLAAEKGHPGTDFVIGNSLNFNRFVDSIDKHSSRKNARRARHHSVMSLFPDGLSLPRSSAKVFRKFEHTNKLYTDRTPTKVSDHIENSDSGGSQFVHGTPAARSPNICPTASTCKTARPDESRPTCERVPPAGNYFPLEGSPGEPKSSRPARPSDFSIEHILRRAGPPPSLPPPPPPPDHIADRTPDPATLYDWLHCTRYRPPKLLRSRKEGPGRRKAGRNPRIPFSAAQAAVLEERFRASPYLGASDVSHLATLLRLSHSRIKIWFQNRRARERRDHGKADTLRTTPPPRPAGASGPVKSAFKPPQSLTAVSLQ